MMMVINADAVDADAADDGDGVGDLDDAAVDDDGDDEG